jgi:membrane protein implicated in regulation of membrane protease activity
MNKVMFALTLILAALILSSARLKDWLSARTDLQFALILTAALSVFIALILRSFHYI